MSVQQRMQVTSQEAMALEDQYGAHNYHPLPVVISRGEGVFFYSPEGTRYYDFLSAYSAVNQGHCHPAIIESMIKQAGILTLTSRAFYNDRLGLAEQYVTRLFGYNKALFMNSGAEAVETAIKLCRKWSYEKKGIPDGQAKIIVAGDNFHGRTTTIISFSSDPDSKGHFGPYTPGFVTIPFNNLSALREILAKDPHIAGFLVEPIQGEAGIIIPDEGYLREAHALCKAHHVLFIADEIQTGLGRTGKLLACQHEEVHPDMLILGKALSGGTMPVSVVLANDEIMMVIHPGQHGSTYGGNPLAAAVTVTALEVLQNEGMIENAEYMGEIFRQRMMRIDHPMVGEVRGKGLMNAVDIKPLNGKKAWDVCLKMAENGVLAKPTHEHIIRFAPPLVINETQMHDACDRIEAGIRAFS